MSVSTEISQGVKHPTRKQPWSVVGLVLLSVVVSAATPIVISQAKKLLKGKK